MQNNSIVKKEKFVIFLHSGTYDRLYQAVTFAQAAVVMGKEVYIFLLFWGLKKFIENPDEVNFSPAYGTDGDAVRETIHTLNIPSVRETLDETKRLGTIKIYACSAAIDIMGMKRDEVEGLVDGIMGLPTIIKVIEDAQTTLFI